MDPLVINLVSASTALVASILGPTVSLAVARRQINANVVSSNRQKWIDALRDHLAELVSLLTAVIVVRTRWQGRWNQGLAAIEADPKLLSKLERIVQVQWKIRLLINPTEADHQALYRTIEQAFEHARADQADMQAIATDIERITGFAQAILKREWERVKRGD